MTQRITAALVATAVLVGGVATVATSASAGGGDSVAEASAKKKKKKKKKKKPPLIAVGTYSGATSNGIPMSLTLNADRATGTMSYCSMVAPVSVSGTSFSVIYIEPVTSDTINAAGFFNAKTRQATGTVNGNGCDSTNQTFTLQAP